LGLASWRDAKSFRHRKRSGTEQEHIADRVVDDLIAVKKWRWYSCALLKNALSEHRPRFVSGSFPLTSPTVTFVIPYMDSGEDRRKGLQLCVESIAGELGGEARVVIVEQGTVSTVDWLVSRFPPSFLQSILLPKTGPFERSATINLGVATASTEVIVLHDGDIMVVSGFRQVVHQFASSVYEAAWPLLMTFYLNEDETGRLPGEMPRLAMSCCRELESISILIRKAAFERLGGFDEGFLGWGSEDNEFYDRAATLNVCPRRQLFGLHAWHSLLHKEPLQAARNKQRLMALRQLPFHERMRQAKPVI
jgi:hypothetical protein